MGKGSVQRPTLISEEERIIRWKYACGEYPDMTLIEFRDKIQEIRERTGLPKR
jgi:hypothetical protein